MNRRTLGFGFAVGVGLAGLAGCSAGDVIVRGTVFNRVGDKAHGLDGASVTVRDARGGPTDADVTDAFGDFRVLAPQAQRIYAVVEADGYVPTSFTGSTGTTDRLRIPDGTFFGVRESDLSDWEARFDGCPGLGEGGVVVGQVRAFNLTIPETGEAAIITNAAAFWQPLATASQALTACYLDASGEGFEQAAAQTGESGWFLIPAVPQGVGTLTVQFTVNTNDGPTAITYDAYMPTGGVVARFPAWVELPTPIGR